jgi:hypothetical protein
MLRYECVPRWWIVSPAARLVYRAAAVLSLTLLPLLMAAQLLDHVRPFLRVFIFLAVLGTALNVIGMEYFLFCFDDSPALKQVFWFCVMIFVPLGPALYCFIVYSRSALIRNGGKDRPEIPARFHRRDGP